MDTKLRELERRAAGGDAEAEKRFLMEKLRTGNYYPVLLQFYMGMLGRHSPVTKGRMFDGYDHSTHLRPAGGSFDCGPLLPVDGILRSVSASVDVDSDCQYTVETVNIKGGWNKILAKSKVLGAGVKASVNRELYARIPGGVPLGVRMGGDQRSTFSAINVTLEIWIPK